MRIILIATALFMCLGIQSCKKDSTTTQQQQQSQCAQNHTAIITITNQHQIEFHLQFTTTADGSLLYGEQRAFTVNTGSTSGTGTVGITATQTSNLYNGASPMVYHTAIVVNDCGQYTWSF